MDPIGLAGGLNAYGFAGGDPVNYSDPFGLCPPQDNVNDCATTFWAERYIASKSAVGKTGNWIMGVLAACGESSCLEKIGLIAGVAGGGSSTEEIGASPRTMGDNPRVGGGRVNTDLPGGRPVGKSIFRHLTKGQPIAQSEMANGGTRRTAPDGSQIRMNPDGSTRVDVPTKPRETIHIDPQQ